ncbi:unnamed protein product [Chondrus crispus]|uniref:Uncharacterized protein n=1 Tax=Chondrus crispus TaxID=2769 RepID=R7QEC4_CHOCR|nr:unnamed protein product [Chondrus crispus]CDF35780.1 unnamed protein product [Chondrus crispus]|eukprot:XP_005715599.1 unnamed protein product [Chondrus crispus]
MRRAALSFQRNRCLRYSFPIHVCSLTTICRQSAQRQRQNILPTNLSEDCSNDWSQQNKQNLAPFLPVHGERCLQTC